MIQRSFSLCEFLRQNLASIDLKCFLQVSQIGVIRILNDVSLKIVFIAQIFCLLCFSSRLKNRKDKL